MWTLVPAVSLWGLRCHGEGRGEEANTPGDGNIQNLGLPCLTGRGRLLGFHPRDPQRGRPLAQWEERTSLPRVLTQRSVAVSKFCSRRLFTELAESPPTHTASWEKMANPLWSCRTSRRGPWARNSMLSSSSQIDISFNADSVTSEKSAFVF